MTKFRTQSRQLLRDLSRAASWMMHRNVGPDHCWRSAVLTDLNRDPDERRPKLTEPRADAVFSEMIARNLLVQTACDFDNTGVPAYTMTYDIQGWDRAVADGRPIYAFCLKIRREWLLMILSFLFGCLVTAIQDHLIERIDGLFQRVTATERNARQ